MNRKPQKFLYGLLAFGPLVLIVFGFVFSFFGMFGMMGMSMVEPRTAPGMMLGFMGLNMLLTMLGFLSMFVSLILFILHALNNQALSQELRIVWVVVMIFFAGIANIIYYVIYFHGDPGLGKELPPHEPPAPLPPGATIV
jgi:hypothetical protein